MNFMEETLEKGSIIIAVGETYGLKQQQIRTPF